MMHSSSSVGDGPYSSPCRSSPSSASIDDDCQNTTQCEAKSEVDPNDDDTTTTIQEFGQVVEAMLQPADENSQSHSLSAQPSICTAGARRSVSCSESPQHHIDSIACSPRGSHPGWSELPVEPCAPVTSIFNDDNFSFAPTIDRQVDVPHSTKADVVVQVDDVDEENVVVHVDYVDEENDYAWGPQHLEYFYARSKGRQLVSSLWSMVPGMNQESRRVPIAAREVTAVKSDRASERVPGLEDEENDSSEILASALAPRESLGLADCSNHTETYIFSNATGESDGNELPPLFSSRHSTMLPSNETGDDMDEDSFETAEEVTPSDMESLRKESLISGGEGREEKPVEDKSDQGAYEDSYYEEQNDESVADWSPESEPSSLHLLEARGATNSKLLSAVTGEPEDIPHKSTLRSEVIEVIQEDVEKVNEAFLDTLQKTSELVHPVARKVYGMSKSASPSTQIGEKSTLFYNSAKKTEQVIANTISDAISNAQVSARSSTIFSTGLSVLAAIESAVEDLRNHNTDASEDAEYLSQLTAGAYV